MTYSFNPHRHVKIWLSPDPTLFLSEQNKTRLITCRTQNHRDEIHFVYDSRLLNEDTITALIEFCSEFNILPHDMLLLEPTCKTSEEKNLLKIYRDELRYFGSDGGNFGTASDILRWLKPIYTLGTYSDFDVVINTKDLPDTITTEKPLLLNLRSYNITRYLSSLNKTNATKTPIHCIDINNDIISIVDPVAALPMIKNIHKRIHLGCATPAVRGSYCPYGFYSQVGEHTLKKLGLSSTVKDDPVDEARLKTLARLHLLYSARETRKLIMSSEKNDQMFGELISIITDPEADDVDISNTNRLEFCRDYLRDSVVYTSGSGPLTLEVAGDIFYEFEKIQNILTYSYQNYGLDDAFKSYNFAMSACEFSNDLSWLTEIDKPNAAGLRFFSQHPEVTETAYGCSICVIS